MNDGQISGALQVIGAGFGRSGTMSLQQALQRLGYMPCYHMRITLAHYSHMRFWIRARSGEPVDYRKFFGKYRATVDWPACEFYRELMAAFPEARVLLNVRDPEEWYDSMVDTLWAVQRAVPWWFPRVVRQMHDDIIWKARFNGEFLDRERALRVYEAHIHEVRRTVPPDRLLVFNVAQGWRPLCDFLDKAVPADMPFPHLNDRRNFKRVILALRVAEWLVPALVLGGVAWLGLEFL